MWGIKIQRHPSPFSYALQTAHPVSEPTNPASQAVNRFHGMTLLIFSGTTEPATTDSFHFIIRPQSSHPTNHPGKPVQTSWAEPTSEFVTRKSFIPFKWVSGNHSGPGSDLLNQGFNFPRKSNPWKVPLALQGSFTIVAIRYLSYFSPIMVISTMSIRSSLCVLNYFWTEDVGWKQEIRNWGMNNKRHVSCSCCCPQKQTGIANWTNQLHLVRLSLHWLNPVDGLSTIRKGTEGNNQVARLVVNYK